VEFAVVDRGFSAGPRQFNSAAGCEIGSPRAISMRLGKHRLVPGDGLYRQPIEQRGDVFEDGAVVFRCRRHSVVAALLPSRFRVAV
jgi:hypothetical protein